MRQLNKVIGQLETGTYDEVKGLFEKNRADNFLHLLHSYRNGNNDDKEIANELGVSLNSLYVLKSRLYDKIQKVLVGEQHPEKVDVHIHLHHITEMCLTKSRELSTAFLEKLEDELKHFAMYNELLVVYSALKKMHLFSGKHFYYSQLYNKHLAFMISLEKCEELLGNFNREICLYHFSRTAKSYETLLFLKKEIENHYALNNSRQIELILAICNVELELFCDHVGIQINIEEKLRKIEGLILQMPEGSPYKCFEPAIDFLFFEYYKKIGLDSHTDQYFEKVNLFFDTLLLYSNISATSLFLISRIDYLQSRERTKELSNQCVEKLLLDPEDSISFVLLGIHKAMSLYYASEYKMAAAELNKILNEHSFKDYFHINIEVRLALSFFNILHKDYVLAENHLHNLQRKIKTEGMSGYKHVLDLIKVLLIELKNGRKSELEKQSDHYTLFEARNTGKTRLLSFLVFELKKKYG